MTDKGLVALQGCALKRLNLDDLWGVTDLGMESVGKIKTMTFAHLGKTGVTDDGLKMLHGLAELKDLVLDNTVVRKRV